MNPRLLTAQGHLLVAGKLVCALFGAWLGGNVVFGVLSSGTWLLAALMVFLPDAWFDWIALFFLWVCRVVIFGLLLIEWVFPKRELPSRI